MCEVHEFRVPNIYNILTCRLRQIAGVVWHLCNTESSVLIGETRSPFCLASPCFLRQTLSLLAILILI